MPLKVIPNDETSLTKGEKQLLNRLKKLYEKEDEAYIYLTPRVGNLEPDFLLIDDKKARRIAENFEINCIGTIGLLSIARDKGIIPELRPLFEIFLQNKRFYSVSLLNTILAKHNETSIIY